MTTILINPPGLQKPVGYSHGAVRTGKMLFIAGQTGTDLEGKLISDDLVAQFEKAIGAVVQVVTEANGGPEDIVKINLLVVDKKEYRDRGKDIGQAYRKHMGRHFPPMTLAEVKGLWDDAKVEIEAVAMLD
ncbi:MAG: RidA family protein [Deltaproteobacteria bacterium]|nr:RidA family protein [Deltaproteobacteria bacterium]